MMAPPMPVRGKDLHSIAAGLCIWLLVLQPITCLEFWTVTDIKNAMYADQKYFGGCYKLLNRTGTVGCEGPQGQIEAMMIRLEDIQAPLTEPRAVLVSTLNATQYLAQLSANPALQANIKMVLVYNSGLPTSDSAATAFPSGAEYTVYGPSSYVWNPFSTGLGTTMLSLPVFWLTDQLASDALWRAQTNVANSFKGSSNWVQAELTMSATQPNATACLGAGTCWPLGGFNVWAAMPPLPFNATSGQPTPNPMPTTLITASLDSNGIFHDFVQAADAPLSGLIAMIAAMRMLQQANQTVNYTRQLVFASLAGEVWNYMGSKRLTWDMARGPTAFTAGLDMTKIDQVIEVGMIGRASVGSAGNQSRLYLHTQRTGGTWGDPAPLLTALENNAAISTDLKLNLSRASTSNPGLPPSSIFSFLRVKPSIAAVLITEFDQQYINPFYQSAFDNGTQISFNPIVSAAVLLARTLHSLAAPATAQPLLVNMTDVADTVTNLALCLVLDSPGMSCPLATSLLNPDFQITDQYVSYAVKHYIGVLQYIHPDAQDPYFKKTLYRFLWNYMGLLASPGAAGAECAFQANQCPPGYSCIGWKGSNKKNAQLMGRCYRTTVSYTPSMSTALDYAANAAGTIIPFFNNASEAWEKTTTPPWPSDPIWTESNWPESTPYVRVLQKEAASTEWAIFGSGLAACLITGLVSWWGRNAFEKHLKAP